MIKGTVIFGLGVTTGIALVARELITERLIVNNNLDGSVSLHHPGVGRTNKPPADVETPDIP